MRQFIYIIIGFFVILFVFMAVFYMIYPYIIRFIKYIYINIYINIYIEKWNKLSEEKKKCILVWLFIIILIFGLIDVITNLRAQYR